MMIERKGYELGDGRTVAIGYHRLGSSAPRTRRRAYLMQRGRRAAAVLAAVSITRAVPLIGPSAVAVNWGSKMLGGSGIRSLCPIDH